MTKWYETMSWGYGKQAKADTFFSFVIFTSWFVWIRILT
jgi:hypothetical protein